MDYITDYISDNAIYYNTYDDLIYKTHLYIVNNLYNNNIIYNDDESLTVDTLTVDTLTVDTLTDQQYFNIMSFLDEIA